MCVYKTHFFTNVYLNSKEVMNQSISSANWMNNWFAILSHFFFLCSLHTVSTCTQFDKLRSVAQVRAFEILVSVRRSAHAFNVIETVILKWNLYTKYSSISFTLPFIWFFFFFGIKYIFDAKKKNVFICGFRHSHFAFVQYWS